MASIDEAYLDMRGTERLHGPPMKSAHALHGAVKQETQLNCSIGIATSRLVAKICSDMAKPNGVLFAVPGEEPRLLAPLDVRKIPGVGKVTEQHLRELGIRRIGDLAGLEDRFLEERFGKWGLALAGKARGEDAGGWFDSEVGEGEGPKSISHEHTFMQDTADVEQLESTLGRLSELVGRRLRDQGLHGRTIQLKLRYADFSTITRAHSLPQSTQIDQEIFDQVRSLFRRNWKRGAAVRLLGVHVSSLEEAEGQMPLIDGDRHQRWQQALSAADRLREKFGEDVLSMGSAMRGQYREKTHENPAALRDKKKDKDAEE
jgi:DNA polymerase-4